MALSAGRARFTTTCIAHGDQAVYKKDMRIEEDQLVELTRDLPEYGLVAGTRGTFIHLGKASGLFEPLLADGTVDDSRLSDPDVKLSDVRLFKTDCATQDVL
jgi:hypothetical protein